MKNLIITVLIGILLIFSICIESVIVTVPLTVIFLLLLAVLKRESWIFAVAFFAGMLLDILTIRPIGQTSIFFILFVFLVFLYERKYEIASTPFIICITIIGSACYSILFHIGDTVTYVLLSVCITLIFWVIATRISQPSKANSITS